jgi:hypothetical protein
MGFMGCRNARRQAIVLVLTGLLVWSGTGRVLLAQQTTFDFEAQGLARVWSAQGPITVARQPLPAQLDPDRRNQLAADGEDRLPAGHAVHLTATGRSVFFVRGDIVPTDWREFEELVFWVYRQPTAERPMTIELQVFESDSRVRFWRKIAVNRHGWQRVVVPLRWMRWSDGRVPRWDRVDRFGVFFRDAGDVWIDSITLRDDDPQLGTNLTAADLQRVATPAASSQAQVAHDDEITLVAATAELDAERLAAHLSAVRARVLADLPFLPEVDHPVKLVVCADKPDYHKFVDNLAAAWNSETPPPKSDGLTLQDICASYWDARQGPLRPVFTHEFVHGLLVHRLQIANTTEWLHEGLASYYQLQYHPQPNVLDIVRRGIADRNLSTPLSQLCNGQPIATNRYWQAMTVVELLCKNAKYRERLPKLIETFRQSGSTDLEPALESVLETTWDQLTQDWRTHCEQQYGPSD